MILPPPILAIDVGNSAIKLGEFRWPDDGLVEGPMRVLRLASEQPEWTRLEAWLDPQTAAAYVISVCPPATDRLLAWLAPRLGPQGVYRLQLTDFPLNVTVDAPERVGQDRLAAAVAAHHLKPADRAAIVIDAGSAITVDVVSPGGDFLGGAILPGWQTMARSLAVGTHQLPLVVDPPHHEVPAVVGRCTEQAIQSGLFWGSVGAVRELVSRMAADWNPPPEQLLAGGDMQALHPYLGPNMRCVPDLVLRGIMWSVAWDPSSRLPTPNPR